MLYQFSLTNFLSGFPVQTCSHNSNIINHIRNLFIRTTLYDVTHVRRQYLITLMFHDPLFDILRTHEPAVITSRIRECILPKMRTAFAHNNNGVPMRQ